MNIIKIILQVVLITPAFIVSAQQTDNIIVRGIVIGADFKPVPYATIISKASNLGTISSDNGNFTLKINKNDTLKFSSIGYKTKFVSVKKLDKEKNYIFLTQETYQLNDVNIIGFTKWQEFKQEFMQKELKPTEQKVLVIKGLPNPFTILVPNTELSTNPITMIYQLFNKKAVIERKQKRWNKTYNKTWREFHRK